MSASGSEQKSLCLLLEGGVSRKSRALRINCRISKHSFGNFMSWWVSSENVSFASTRKGETLPKLVDLLKNELFVVLEEGESFSTRVCSPAEQRLETGLRCFPKLEKNWSRQLTRNNYFDWKKWVNPLIPIYFFVIWLCKSDHYPWEIKHPAKNANELRLPWRNLAGKSHIHGHKENGL